jgi:hypothetical protein
MLASYTIDAKERPTSHDIAVFLDNELSNLVHGRRYKTDKKIHEKR